jgi:RNA methyltransferase, TrmH family
VERISSRQNAVVKRFRALARSGAGSEDILLEGAHLIEEALDSGLKLEVAAFTAGAVADRSSTLARRVERAGTRTVVASEALFQALSPVRQASGAVAIAKRPAATLESVLSRAPQLLLLLDGVQDPGNVGAIIRAAEACGATGVVIGEGSADPFGWKALRGAMGSTFRLPVIARAAIQETVRGLRGAGVRVLATVPRAGRLLSHVDLRAPSAILLGAEGAGIPEHLIEDADERLTIPMQAPVESLNVAIAAALILYEASRQRSDVTV